ncbi:AAA family ATPase [Williamsia muralis]|uniref:AAA family ATPase n=1 Tax=Williamsia marianensis TaxID=85044 RepID=A0ABU4EVX7_WILMA|nr:AAA family ATPase [Williamsia muralis]MDV7135408.1 AAA family ATPase [Williamsia muralis]
MSTDDAVKAEPPESAEPSEMADAESWLLDEIVNDPQALMDADVQVAARKQEVAERARYLRAAEGWKPPTPSAEIVVELAKNLPPVEYVVEDLAPKGSNVLLVAEAKAGKTTLVMNLVTAMVQGEKFLGRYAVDAVPEGSSITYLNFELDEAMALGWLRAMLLDADPAGFKRRLFVDHWKGYTLPLPADHVEDYIVEQLLERGSKVLVIDPYGAAINHEENNNDDIRAWTNAIDRIARRAELAIVIIAAHSGSTSVGASEPRVRGGYRLEDWMSVKWSYTHGGEINELPPDNMRYLSARGRDVAVPQFAVDYEPSTRRLNVAAGGLSKQDNQIEQNALRAYHAMVAYRFNESQNGVPDDQISLNAGDLAKEAKVNPTGKLSGPFTRGRKLAVERGWLVETKLGNSKIYSVGEVSPDRIKAPAYRGADD